MGTRRPVRRGAAPARSEPVALVAPCTRTERSGPVVCFNRGMVSLYDAATGPLDLKPFWPSRQAHHFVRECCRASDARAHSLGR